MDALLIALLLSAFAAMAVLTYRLAMFLALRFRNDPAVLSAIMLATIVNCAVSAAGGWLLAGFIGTSARTLFFALSFLFAGAGMLMPVKRPDDVGGWRIGAFFTSFFAMFILEFGDKSQFIVAAVAMRTGDPVLSAVGGSLGILLALAPRSEEHTSELQSLMRISYAVFCLKKKTTNNKQHITKPT